MPDGTCSVVGCERPQHCKQLCTMHYSRLHKTGQVGEASRRWGSDDPALLNPCTVGGCERGVHLRGLCRLHYERFRKTGDAGPPEPLVRARGTGRAPCSLEGCDRPMAGRGLCKLHHTRWRRSGDPGPAELLPPRMAPPKGPCRVDGCARVLRHPSSQLCERHHARWKWSGDPGPAEIKTQRAADSPCLRSSCNRRVEIRGLCAPHYFAEHQQANRARRDELAKKWREANPDRVRINGQATSRRRRARLRHLPAEPYTLQEIVARDGLDCVLCGEELELSVDYLHPRSVTVEHLECVSWPDSAGDVLSNVAAAHRKCNRDRGNHPHPAAARKRAELAAMSAASA